MTKDTKFKLARPSVECAGRKLDERLIDRIKGKTEMINRCKVVCSFIILVLASFLKVHVCLKLCLLKGNCKRYRTLIILLEMETFRFESFGFESI